jgi:hypothetical protein
MVARVLKLIDEEEDLEAGQLVEVAPGPIPEVLAPVKESEVEVIEEEEEEEAKEGS